MRAGQYTGAIFGGRYRLAERLGGGGMGDVYLGEHLETGRRLAIKVLNETYSGSPEAIERFRREAQAASRIEHENIVSVLDFGHEPKGPHYMVMEILRGESLDVTLKQLGSLPWPVVRSIARQICDALAKVHDMGIVHRDLKPANCFRTRLGDNDFFIKLLDFGVAKLRTSTRDDVPNFTATGAIMGTLAYMAPEQASDSAHVDHRADIYSLGVIVYQLVSGRLPISGQSDVQMLFNLVYRPPTPLGDVCSPGAVPLGLEAVLERALAKTPDARYASVAEFSAALTALELGDFGKPPRASPPPEFALDSTALALSSREPLYEPVLHTALDGSKLPPADPAIPKRSSSRAWTIAASLVTIAAASSVIVLTFWNDESAPAVSLPQAVPSLGFREPPVAQPTPSASDPAVPADAPPTVSPPTTRPEPAAVEPSPPTAPPDLPTTSAPKPTKAGKPRPRTDPEKEAKVDDNKPVSPSPETVREIAFRQARVKARESIAGYIARHAARATVDRVWINVVFDSASGVPRKISVGSNLEHTTFGQRLRDDIQTIRLPSVARDVVIDESFNIPQDG